ncbi:MAG: caspase family protein [Cytophagaceae bacterium]|nr:caspase family protein [Cytophagaceae bacterium]
MKARILLMLLLLSWSYQANAQAKTQLKNVRVFMIGVLEWANKVSFDSFDKRGRLDAKILKHFKDSGVPEDKIVYLKDKQATTDAVRAAYREFLQKSNPDETLIFYYCGHGYKDEKDRVCFANYTGADFSAMEIVKTANELFKGKTAYFFADCCNSGGLADEVKKYKNKQFVALNSVVPKDLSTGNWTFSNALLYGLQGQSFVDKNSNGSITLSELAQYIDEEMAVVEEQKSAYFIPASMQNMAITTGVPKKKDPKVGMRVMVDYDNEPYMGFVTGKNAEGQYIVRFYSYLNNETDFVDASELKPVICNTDFPVAAKVKVYSDYDEKWLPARVVKKFMCLHYISYDGFGAEWNEWVSTDKIKK